MFDIGELLKLFNQLEGDLKQLSMQTDNGREVRELIVDKDGKVVGRNQRSDTETKGASTAGPHLQQFELDSSGPEEAQTQAPQKIAAGNGSSFTKARARSQTPRPPITNGQNKEKSTSSFFPSFDLSKSQASTQAANEEQVKASATKQAEFEAKPSFKSETKKDLYKVADDKQQQTSALKQKQKAIQARLKAKKRARTKAAARLAKATQAKAKLKPRRTRGAVTNTTKQAAVPTTFEAKRSGRPPGQRRQPEVAKLTEAPIATAFQIQPETERAPAIKQVAVQSAETAAAAIATHDIGEEQPGLYFDSAGNPISLDPDTGLPVVTKFDEEGNIVEQYSPVGAEGTPPIFYDENFYPLSLDESGQLISLDVDILSEQLAEPEQKVTSSRQQQEIRGQNTDATGNTPIDPILAIQAATRFGNQLYVPTQEQVVKQRKRTLQSSIRKIRSLLLSVEDKLEDPDAVITAQERGDTPPAYLLADLGDSVLGGFFEGLEGSDPYASSFHVINSLLGDLVRVPGLEVSDLSVGQMRRTQSSVAQAKRAPACRPCENGGGSQIIYQGPEDHLCNLGQALDTVPALSTPEAIKFLNEMGGTYTGGVFTQVSFDRPTINYQNRIIEIDPVTQRIVISQVPQGGEAPVIIANYKLKDYYGRDGVFQLANEAGETVSLCSYSPLACDSGPVKLSIVKDERGRTRVFHAVEKVAPVVATVVAPPAPPAVPKQRPRLFFGFGSDDEAQEVTP